MNNKKNKLDLLFDKYKNRLLQTKTEQELKETEEDKEATINSEVASDSSEEELGE